MDDMRFLWADPRPELRDTRYWHHLFRLIPSLHSERRCELHKRLWTMRSMGMMLRFTHIKTEFVTVLGQACAWESDKEFEANKLRYLVPYREEIGELFALLQGTAYEAG